MSEYFAGRRDEGPHSGLPGGQSNPWTPFHGGGAQAASGARIPGRSSAPRARSRGRHAAPPPPERVRFGVPFNGILPLWHEGAEITWHRPLDDVDFASILGLGHVHTEPGPSVTPGGWQELVEVATLVPADPDAEEGPVLRLRAVTPSGRRAINDPGGGAPIRLSKALPVEEAMGAGAGLDLVGFSVHIGRLMLRAARDGAILLFTLRAPRDPEAHHLLSVPSEVDSRQVMHFHLGTLLDMSDGAWARAKHSDNMTLLDLDVPYQSLLGGGAQGAQGLELERLTDMARPVVECLLRPGFPFALGSSVIMPAGPQR
ncbi:hypothetical protein [Actinomyces sp.]|uniref:hypothetical protein n=1 Tax=Actinomyces sp. TaxID=29317 RepID=UPI0026DC1286|nr:hypothetical protein [Actinomyces sp.]MDO4901836.1 hypothetical protein [Actinomyces sp.]